MGTDYYIYAEIKDEQYLIGFGRYEMIRKWFNMLLDFKQPELATIIHENDYINYSMLGEASVVNLKVYSVDEIYSFVLQKEVVLGENTHYINPYDQDTELYKLLSQHEEYLHQEKLKYERRAKEDAEWNALSKEEQKRIQDEYIQEAIRIAKNRGEHNGN